MSGRKDHSGSDGGGHEYVGEVVVSVRKFAALRLATAFRRRAYHLRPLPTAAPGVRIVPQSDGVGVNRPGCEYLVIPAFNAFKIPDNISDDLASIFDPFGAVHTALFRPRR
jgi:threonine 3-dehydrogenase